MVIIVWDICLETKIHLWWISPEHDFFAYILIIYTVSEHQPNSIKLFKIITSRLCFESCRFLRWMTLLHSSSLIVIKTQLISFVKYDYVYGFAVLQRTYKMMQTNKKFSLYLQLFNGIYIYIIRLCVLYTNKSYFLIKNSKRIDSHFIN